MPLNLFTQSVWVEILMNGGIGDPLEGLNNDPNFHRCNGWQKMQYTSRTSNGESVTFHYQNNLITRRVNDIKIVDYKPPK